MIIEIDIGPNDDYVNCPLKSDLNCCNAIPNSPINFCPETVEMDDWSYMGKSPDTCPLRNEGVVIIRKG